MLVLRLYVDVDVGVGVEVILFIECLGVRLQVGAG